MFSYRDHSDKEIDEYRKKSIESSNQKFNDWKKTHSCNEFTREHSPMLTPHELHFGHTIGQKTY